MSQNEAEKVIRQVTPLSEEDKGSGFTCGDRALDSYFTRHALNNDRQGIGKTFVLRGNREVGEPPVAGFYTLSMASITSNSLKDIVSVKLPRYPMPVALLARLAIHQEMQGRGVGSYLLSDALIRVLRVADLVGCLEVIVDAKNEAAEAFYAKFGFVVVEAEKWPRRMYLPLETIQRSVQP